MKILIIEAYTDSNIGSGALVENSILLLRNKYPQAEFRVMAHYPKAFENRYGNSVTEDVFKYPYNRGRVYQIYWLAVTLFWMSVSYILPEGLRKVFFKRRLKEFYWADLVVSIGAERINDKYIFGVLFSEYTYAIIKKINRKLILFPSTYGPFLYGWTTKMFKNIFPKIDLVYSRDNESFNVCKKLLGSESNLVNTSDVAIFQEWSDKKDELQKKYGKPIVGISVMKWIYVANTEETEYSNYDAYVEQMVLLIKKILGKYDVQIILYPTNFPVNGAQGDDVVVCKEIYDKCNRPDDLDYIQELVSPSEFKSMLSASELNITTRMHACILSTGAYIPTISIAYLFKLKEYMDGLGLKDYSVDIEYFEHNKVFGMFEKAWAERENISLHLKKTIDSKKVQLEDSLKRIDTILSN